MPIHEGVSFTTSKHAKDPRSNLLLPWVELKRAPQITKYSFELLLSQLKRQANTQSEYTARFGTSAVINSITQSELITAYVECYKQILRSSTYLI